MRERLPVSVTRTDRTLTTREFQKLASVPSVVVWFANIDNRNTLRAYKADAEAFVVFTGIEIPTSSET